MWMRFIIRSGQYEVRDQYRIYDEGSFVADVGGYLGLLLGHSIFSMLGSIKEAARKYLAIFKRG